MATSLMAAGLPPGRSYQVAERIEVALHRDGREAITSAELRSLAARALEEEVGPRYAENYRTWQRAQERSVPLVVLIGGTAGVGKSTVATTVANRLGIVRIVSTDAIREVMRGIFTRKMMPSLHTSSFEVAELLPDPPGDADPAIAGFRQQVQAVAVGVAQVVRRAVLEGTDVIVEGTHVVPGLLDLPHRDEAILAPLVITVDDRAVHRNHFVARGQDARARGANRYLEHFDEIRKIQRYVRALAREHGIPIVPSYGLDTTVSRVMELVVSATTDLPQPGHTVRHDPGPGPDEELTIAEPAPAGRAPAPDPLGGAR